MIETLLGLVLLVLLLLLYFVIQNYFLRVRGEGTKLDVEYEKVCPLCRKGLTKDDEIYGKLSTKNVNQVIILGCKYCYRSTNIPPS